MTGLRLRLFLILTRFGRYARDRIAIDTRTLAVFRIAIGVLILADLIARSRRFTEFYTEAGFVPQAVARDAADSYTFSIFFVSSNSHVTAALFVIHGLIALQLIIGYRTRLATVASFIFVISLDNRNPLVLSYADALFRLLLFWAIFLPLGERWSVDAVHRGRSPRFSIANLASSAILIQMFYMYFGNAILKFAGDLWRSGEATPLVFGLDHMTWVLAPVLREYPSMLSIGGWFWFFMLSYVSWLLLLSAGRVRTSLVAVFVLVHLSFALTVRIGAFPYVAIAGVILFLQAPFWNDLRLLLPLICLRQLRSIRTRLIVLAESFPRIEPRLTLPGRALTAGYHSVVTLAVLAVLVLPPLAYLQSAGFIRVDVAKIERPVSAATRSTAVNQPPWTIFAPTPRTDDVFYVFAAQTEDDELYDLYNDRLLTYDRPPGKLHRQFKHYRERFYMMNIENHEASEILNVPRALATHLCEQWAVEREIVLTQIDMYAVSEKITMDTINKPAERERSTRLLYQHGCNGDVTSEVAPPDF